MPAVTRGYRQAVDGAQVRAAAIVERQDLFEDLLAFTEYEGIDELRSIAKGGQGEHLDPSGWPAEDHRTLRSLFLETARHLDECRERPDVGRDADDVRIHGLDAVHEFVDVLGTGVE